MPNLVVLSPEFQGRVFELTEQEITLGRLPDNQIHIDHGSVSGHHATLIYDNGDYIVRDLNSTNGTRINAGKISQQKLQRGDTLQVGHIQIEYQSEIGGNIQPLPPPKHGIELDTENQSVRPNNFVNASPFEKIKADKKDLILKKIILALIIIAILAVAFFVFRLFQNSQ